MTLEEVVKQISELQEAVKSLTSDVSYLKEEVERYDLDAIDETAKEVANLAQTVDTVEDDVHDLQDTVENFERRIVDLESYRELDSDE